ncbi:hypothetical protein QR680_000531 [Steinernema hermaphroditum]|uniref:Uncharacterized protein n=1 Tax=Steinernema hermaphroditum TaxID=289476 RepID=A0AA39LDR1_9BILA|nr:hypothetical protein QR680_000531 [Steinernema hermaphroditum]
MTIMDYTIPLQIRLIAGLLITVCISAFVMYFIWWKKRRIEQAHLYEVETVVFHPDDPVHQVVIVPIDETQPLHQV